MVVKTRNQKRRYTIASLLGNSNDRLDLLHDKNDTDHSNLNDTPVKVHQDAMVVMQDENNKENIATETSFAYVSPRTDHVVINDQVKIVSYEQDVAVSDLVTKPTTSSRMGYTLDALEAALQAQITAREALETHIGHVETKLARYSSKHEDISMVRNQLGMALEEVEDLKLELYNTRRKQTQTQSALLQSESVRREIHEKYMALRGNMRIFCRVKPCADPANSPCAMESLNRLHVNGPTSSSVDGLSETRRSWNFEFDHILSPNDDQEKMFAEVHGLVQSALDGHDVCIFAYGQTGSGKTHTMMGSENDQGIIPRSLKMIFSTCHNQEENFTDVTFTIKVSFLEIYNDALRDLLASDKKTKLSIKVNESGAFVENLQILPVHSVEDIEALLERAMRERTTAQTTKNEKSSRSHALLTLYLEIKRGGVSCQSTIHLVDLAGSERAQGGEKPQTQKERCHINSSLTALKSTLQALKSGQRHVPYRDCKLTFLMSRALTADKGKSLMICTIASDQENLSESISTLRFAENLK